MQQENITSIPTWSHVTISRGPGIWDRIDRVTRNGASYFEAFSGGSYIGRRDTLCEIERFLADYLKAASAMEKALDC